MSTWVEARRSFIEEEAEATIFTGLHQSDYDEQADSGAITEVTDPAGSDLTVFKMSVDNDDTTGSETTVRAQLISPNVISEGLTFWFRTGFYLPADFPTSEVFFVNLWELPYGPPFDGSPPLSMKVANVDEGASKILWQRNSTYSSDIPWMTDTVLETWFDVIGQVEYAEEGFVELWVNGEQLTFFPEGQAHNPSEIAPTTHLAMKVLDESNKEGPAEAIIQNYRERDGKFSNVTNYQNPLVLGATKTSVERAY